MKTIIISPAYNVGRKIETVLCGLQSYKSRTLFVDDGSTDNTYKLIKHAGYSCIRCRKNGGVSAALEVGIKWALKHGYDSAVILDSDGQHDPGYILEFEEKLKVNELVTGNRFHDFATIPSAKLASNAIISLVLQELYGNTVFDISCGYKAFRLQPWVLETLADGKGYSFIYDIYFRAMKEHRKVGIVNISCIYPAEEFYYTKRSEILGFLKAIKQGLHVRKTTWMNDEEVCECIEQYKDFALKIRDFVFYGFYLEKWDGYSIQTDMKQLQKYFVTMQSNSKQKLLKQLNKNHLETFHIWCGAGISIDAPCGLPAGYGLSQQIFQEYMQDNDRIADIWERCNGVIKNYIAIHPNVRPEVAVSCITRLEGLQTTRDFYHMFSKIEDVSFNENHVMLAAFVHAGKTIFTANFDTCIESAFEAAYREKMVQENLCGGKIVCYSAKTGGKIYHFHGTFAHGKVAGASVENVLKGFDKEALELLETALKNSINLFLGYSFSDDYDINNVLRTKSQKTQFFVCNHNGKDAGLESKVPDICGENVQIINANTSDLLKEVLEKLQIPWKTVPYLPYQDWKDILKFPVGRCADYKTLYTTELLNELRISGEKIRPGYREQLLNLDAEVRKEIGSYFDVLIYYVNLLGGEKKEKAKQDLKRDNLKKATENRSRNSLFSLEKHIRDEHLIQKLQEISESLSKGKMLQNTPHETVSALMRLCLAKKIIGGEIKNQELLKRVVEQICQLDYSQGEEVYIFASGLRYRYLLNGQRKDILDAVRIYYDVGNLEGVISCLITAAVVQASQNGKSIRKCEEWKSARKLINITGNRLYERKCRYIEATDWVRHIPIVGRMICNAVLQFCDRYEEPESGTKEKNMTLGMDNAIVVIKGDITNKKLLKELEVDAIVNAANPTLMGSKQGVDGAIHDKLPKLKKKICKELGTDRLANRQRCERGKAVTTSDGKKKKKLCRYIIHTVGSKYDGSGGTCSSSRIQTLENCYRSVMDEVKKHPDIRNVAVPVIGAGDYGFPFKLAMEIAVCSINNALLEWRQKDPELFEKAKLERVYIFIYHPSKAKTDEKFQTANWVMQKYHQLLMNNRKITYLTSREAHLSYWKEIHMYDRERGYFSIARTVREILMFIRLLFLPVMFLKDLFGGRDWEKRRSFVEWLVACKIALPFVSLMFLNRITVKWLLVGLSALIVYSLADTLTYLLILMMMSDIQRPSANLIRTWLMLFMNYVEAALDLSVLYGCCERWFSWKNGGLVSVRMAVKCGLLGFQNIPEHVSWAETLPWMSDVFLYADSAIKFFFFSLVLVYLASHMKQKEFLS